MSARNRSIRLSDRLRGLLRLLLIGLVVVIVATSGDSRLSQVERIEQRGSLIMLTVNGASTYFLGAEGETGYEYELALDFAESLGVALEVNTVPTVADLIPALRSGKGDFIAANLTRVPERQSSLRFGPVYEEVRQVVVYRRGSARPASLDDMTDGRLVLLEGSSFEALLADHPADLSWETLPRASIEDIFDGISNEEIDYTIIDSNILELNRRFFPAIRPAFELGEPQPLAWATRRSNDDSLVQQMHRHFAHASESGRLAEIRHRHYDHVEAYEPVGTFTFMRQMRERLPPLRHHFEEAAERYDLDWRLLAAVGYQESHWNPNAVSRTGVRGVMMLTQRTARQLGVENRQDPEQSIMGGARYLRSMIDRVPERIDYPDRLWLALAAYNVGYGHLEDARRLTEGLGGNPDRWLDVRDHLPLLTQERYYSQTRFGYARGYEPVHFVENIRTFFEILLWMEGREHPLLAGVPSGIETE
ncbi:membrane-bound lytic murein transglycosylase MltF [Wenzhouxiangella sp. AB-CW3]|uniref:membrane-bound lytic murein transglycosylase MltF n=1 Tax=Wenzhouxiangella sp. AB-CW3 TaxID=2771012 RepID=UPI00168AD7D6|nr:membrane-bound lytic murein transglycosylase MltF [Wenzhouxiangella sp. AB-CW3]QOC21557.1 membrane-bound lytic murein transglycosylase MltF [Wenzhouxiangella sp. AB-CW3]